MIEDVLPEINYVLCDMITLMFGQHFENNALDTRAVGLPPADKYMVFMQINGDDIEGELILSFNTAAAMHLLESTNFTPDNEIHQRKLLHSILGELANVVTGEIVTHDVFLDTFFTTVFV